MKKRFIVLAAVLTLTAGMIAGCGSTEAAPEAAAQTEEATEVQEKEPETTEAKEETAVGMANPWVSISEAEANENCLRLFKAPEGAVVGDWLKCDDLGDADKGLGPLVQLNFSLDDREFTARAQQGASEDTDISGMYVDWTVGPEDATLANWGGGNMPAKTYRAITDTGYVDLITWYDMEIGIAYSLSVAAEDLDGFDIQAIAEQMYAAENEPFVDVPEDFLQEQSGITSFETYDDVIAALTSGQGYAYIKVIGSDEDLLAVTDLVFEYDHSACEISVYGKPEGKVKQIGLVTGNGSANPIRLKDGIIYAGTNHSYETYFVAQESGALMMKDYITDGVDTGTNTISGFTREKNSFNVDFTDFTGGQEELDKLMKEREDKPVIEFTVVQ